MQYLPGLLALVLLSACAFGSVTRSSSSDAPEPQPVGSCVQRPSFYSGARYKVRAIRIVSPFDYLHTIRQLMTDALASTDVHAGDNFSADTVSKARRKIRERLMQQGKASNLPVMVNVVSASIENCRSDAQPPSLDVVFTTFSSWAPFVFTQTFENQASQSDDPATASRVRTKKFEFVPKAGYDATAKLFGGGRTSLTTPAGKLDLDVSASSEILSSIASFSGKHTWEAGWVRSAEWSTGFSYDDSPTGINRLKRARLMAQLFANSAPTDLANSLFRFGVSISGGHDQSNLFPDQLPPGSLSSSPIGEIKTYIGTSGRMGRSSFKISYGFQFGEAHSCLCVDFAKHIVDGAYNLRLLPAPHKPIDIDARLTAGWMQDLGGIPAAERFFGGNSEQQFIIGDSWQIRAAPFIRSIPRNRLNRLSPEAAIGGQTFVSTNITVGMAVWNRPLMPEEIRENQEFHTILGGELKSAQKTLESYWISKDKAVSDVLTASSQVIGEIHELRKVFDGAKSLVPRELSDRFTDCDFQLSLAEGFAKILETETNSSKRFIAMKGLIAESDDGSIDNLIGCISDLRVALGVEGADAKIEQFKSVQRSARGALSKVDKSAAEKKANRDMVFIDQTVNSLVDEMNFFSISPIAILDMAKIGPQQALAGGGLRYGVGGGLRFTLLDTIRVDAGYAVNPNPKPWEGRGAAFFSLIVVSLFR